jgi:hypothetical protein
MKKSVFFVLLLALGFIFLGLLEAADRIPQTSNKIEGATRVWGKPAVENNQATADTLSLGAEQLDIEAVGSDKGAQNKLEALSSAVEELKAKAEGYQEAVSNWLNEKPVFGVTEDGGIDGYRQEIKNWLNKFPKEDFSDVIKEIDANF